MTALVKTQKLDWPKPLPYVPPVVRKYTVTIRIPKYKYIPVFSKKEADYIVFPDSPDPTVIVGVSPNGRDYIRFYNWLKIVIDGYTTIKKEVVEVINQPQPPEPKPTPVPDAWDATARSIDAFADPVRAKFTLGSTTRAGVRAGLTFLESSAGTEQSHIIHGFKIENGLAYVQTQAPKGVDASNAPTEIFAAAMVVAAGDVMRIDIVAGVVSYYVNDQLMARMPSYVSNIPVHLGAALYSVSDSISDASIEQIGSTGRGKAELKLAITGGRQDAGRLHMRLQAIGGQSSDGLQMRLFAQGSDNWPGYGQLRAGPLHATGFGYTGADGEGAAHLFYRLVALGSDTRYSAGHANLLLATIIREDDYPSEVHGFTEGKMTLLESVATFPHRGIYSTATCSVQFDGAISPVVRHRALGSLRMTVAGSLRILESLVARCLGASDLNPARVCDAALVSQGEIGAPLMGLLMVSDVLHTSGMAGTDLQGQRTVGDAFGARVVGDTSMQAGQVLQAALQALGFAGVAVGELGGNLSVWSINTATGASSAYENYPFNSFARIGGRYFGAKPDGIYELGGDDDVGQPITAHVNLGQRNFGSNRLKSWPTAYLGVSSRGYMVVRVTTDQGTYTYRARSSGRDMRTQRVDLGRGLRASYITLELMNEAGADFDLDGVEFSVIELGRRI